MADSGAQAPGTGRASGRRLGRSTGDVPFWVHQVVDMLLGVLVMVEGARDGNHTAVLVGFGAALLLLSLLSDGALGAWSLIGRRTHRVVDVLLALAFAAAPLVFSISDALPIAVLEGAAIALLWLSIRTSWVKRPSAAQRGLGSRFRLREPAATAEAEPEQSETEVPAARRLGAVVGRVREDGARTAGRATGRVVGRARTEGPRAAGRAVGRVISRARSRRPPA